MKFRGSLIAAVAVGALLLTGCASGGSGGASPDNATLTIAQEAEPPSLDPAFAHEGIQPPYFQAAYDSLIRRMPDGEYAPMLATSWTLSDDKLTLSLELRDDVTFSDGAPFNAEAVKANFEHFQTAGGTQQNWL